MSSSREKRIKKITVKGVTIHSHPWHSHYGLAEAILTFSRKMSAKDVSNRSCFDFNWLAQSACFNNIKRSEQLIQGSRINQTIQSHHLRIPYSYSKSARSAVRAPLLFILFSSTPYGQPSLERIMLGACNKEALLVS